MKKLGLCLLIFLFLFSFCGCQPEAPEEINMHIDSSYTAKMGDLSLKGLIIYTEEGEMYLDVSTPDELSGLSFSFKDDFTMSYRGLNAITESDYLPESSFAQSIKNSLDNAKLTKPELKKAEDESFIATAKGDSGCYKIYTDVKGNIKKIEIIGADVTININD